MTAFQLSRGFFKLIQSVTDYLAKYFLHINYEQNVNDRIHFIIS